MSIHGSGDFSGSDLTVKTAGLGVFGTDGVSIKEAGSAKTKVLGSGNVEIESRG